jgi:hypothetical protein
VREQPAGVLRRIPRPFLYAAAILALVVVAWALYLAVTGYAASRQLEHVRTQLRTLETDSTAAGTSPAQLTADQRAVAHSARSAAGDTAGPLWSGAGHLPYLGRSLRAVRGASDVVDSLAADALPQVVSARESLRSGTLAADHGIALAPLEAAAGPLRQAGVATAQALAAVEQLPRHTGVGPIDAGVTDLRQQLGSLSGQLATAGLAATVAPPMLGADGPRAYFVGFENEAESRGLGGLPGAFAILTADKGRLTFTRFENDADLDGVAASVPFPADYTAQYGADDPTGTYRNSDISPNFPDAARIWIALWQKQTGQRLDGAMVIDPTALGALLAVTGPASLPDGTAVSAGNVVALTERDAYDRFAGDNAARRAFLISVAQAASSQVLSAGPPHAIAVLHALGAMVAQRRVLLYSTRPAEEATLAGQPVAGLLAPASGAGAVAGPYLMVSVVNGAGNKVDYYLQRSVRWSAPAGCASWARTSVVTVALTNDAPPGLPPYAGGRSDSEAGDGTPDGTDRLAVSLYATVGAGFSHVTLDGAPAGLVSYTEQGRPVFVADLEIVPGATRTLVVDVTIPGAARGPATIVTQPLVSAQRTTVAVPAC